MLAGAIVGDSAPVVATGSVAAYARSVLEQVQSLPRSGTRTARTSLPGLSVRTDSFDDAMAGAMQRNFLESSGAAPFPTLEMAVSIVHATVPGSPMAAKWSPGEPYVPHHVAQALEAAGLRAGYYFDLDHWHVYDPSQRAGVQLMRRPGCYPPWEAGAPLRPFLHWHYAQRGMRLAHGGTLGVDGTGVLLAGGGGSGKSGTVIAGLLHGLQSVGDDYVLLNADRSIRAYPLYATLKQDPAGYKRLGLDRRLSAGGLNWQGKHQFRIGEVASEAVPPWLELGALFVPHIDDASRTRICHLPRAEAMIALAASSIHQMPGERESGFRFFSMIARRLPCFRLDLGRDPAEIADAIGNFIGRLQP